MNIVDLLFLLVATLAMFRGWRRGLAGLVFELGGGFLGFVVGVALGPRLAALITDSAGFSAVLISLLVVFGCLSIGQTAGFIVGHRFGAYAHSVRLGHVNQALGAVGGLVLTALMFWLIGSLFVNGPARPVAKALHGSAVLRRLNDALPQPPNVLALFSQYLNTNNFPQVFIGLPRVSEPVRLPSNAQAARAVQAASESTVRIVVPACDGTQLGSGWIVDESTVVTNAHVVAGGEAVQVQTLDEESVSGRVVVFDDETDVAVVHLDEEVSAPPLELAGEDFDRGQVGATIGYPGDADGRQEGRGAAIQARYTAVGRDIYGRGQVGREVYELRADVRQGDSGGPFVVPDGRVAGVVFAASTTDPGVGYALTGSEIVDEIERGIGRTRPVGTNGCTR